MPWGFEPEESALEGDPSRVPPEGFVEAFVCSMPPRYAVLFDPRAIERHASVAYRRGGRLAHAEVWRVLGDGSAALCIVAQDRAGLLSAIAAALVAHRLDVVTAFVFSRSAGGAEAEAVDLLWVRRAASMDTAPVDADEATSIAEVLGGILAGTVSLEEIAREAPLRRRMSGTDVVVRFEATDEEGHAVLLVEAPDRPGLLLAIAFELFQQGAQIVRSLVRTAERRAFNRFVVAELSGAPLPFDRRTQIRSAVFSALARESSLHTLESLETPAAAVR